MSEEPAAQYYLRHAGAQTVSCAAGEDCGNKAYFLRKCAREQICRIEILWNEINAVLFLLHRYDHSFPLCGRHKKARKSLAPLHSIKNFVLKYA